MQLIKSISDRQNSEKYLLLNDEKQIGFGYISSSELNPIEIFIYENERSNGYGKYLFSELLNIIKESGTQTLFFEFELKNTRMRNILFSFGAIQISNSENLCKWVLPLNQ